jgi:hypothetical protein
LRLATLPRSADYKPTAFAPPRDWSSAGIDSSARTEVRSLSDQWRWPRFWRMRQCCTQRPRFRGLIPLPVGVTALGFLRCSGALALLGLASLGRSPSLPLGFQANSRCLVGARGLPRGPPRSLSAPGHGIRTSPLLSGTSGTTPVLGPAPCASEFQRAGKLADLFRGCRPLQGSCPRPEQKPGCRTCRDEVSFRRWCAFPGGDGISFSLPGAEALNILKPCDSIIERTFLVFADLPDIRDTRSFSPNSGSPDAQTRGSD